MNNELIAFITLLISLVAGGFLLSIPLMRKQQREFLENENNFIQKEKQLSNKVSTLKNKVGKLKDKFKKKKKK